MTESQPAEILLVEDSATDAELILRALKPHRLSHKLRWVKDGAEALDYLFRTGNYAQRRLGQEPKLILLDLKLPKVDGIEVLRRIKADERTRPLRVVMLTSSAEEPDIIESYRLGANSYIIKPVDFEKLLQRVSEVSLYWTLTNQPPYRS